MDYILDFTTDGQLKTQIMYLYNLSYRLGKKYLDILLNANMIGKESKDGKNYFVTTDKGKIFENAHKLARYLMNTGENSYPLKPEDSKLLAQMEAALSPVLSIEVSKEAYVTLPQQLTVINR